MQVNMNVTAHGHVTIRDKESGEILLDRDNAIHYGNMSAAIVRALAGDSTGFVRYVAFGNGASSVQSDGTIIYAEPNVNETYDTQAQLYSETYRKDVLNSGPNNYVEFVTNANSDLRVIVTLSAGEPSDLDIDANGVNYTAQQTSDLISDFDSDYVFDEIALIDSDGIMLSHVRFHPVLKSANRIIEIEYTVRIQMA